MCEIVKSDTATLSSSSSSCLQFGIVGMYVQVRISNQIIDHMRLRHLPHLHSYASCLSQQEQSAAPPAIVPSKQGLISITFFTVWEAAKDVESSVVQYGYQFLHSAELFSQSQLQLFSFESFQLSKLKEKRQIHHFHLVLVV